MEHKSELVRLEEIVDNVLAKYKQAKKTCANLELMLEERNAECDKLKETIAELRDERGVVGERVAGLIDRIEKWETELETGELAGDEDLAEQQGKLFQNDQDAAM